MIINNIEYKTLSYLEVYFNDTIDGIPEESGIYYWVYYPEINPITSDEKIIKQIIDEYVSKPLFFNEQLNGRYKYTALISEKFYPDNGEIFGLSASKSKILIEYLKTPVNRQFFVDFFREMCFSRPFYVGKADNLKRRLGLQHFRSKSEILPEIDRLSINHSNIWIGYRTIPDTSSEGINNIFEEIFSRTIKPGLTKKPN